LQNPRDVTDQNEGRAFEARSTTEASMTESPQPYTSLPRPIRRAIDPDEFRRFLEHASSLDQGEPASLRAWMDFAEAWQISQMLRRCRGNRTATARALGIGRRTLYAKMEKLGITASWGV